MCDPFVAMDTTTKLMGVEGECNFRAVDQVFIVILIKTLAPKNNIYIHTREPSVLYGWCCRANLKNTDKKQLGHLGPLLF